jgi:hypothetical protein
MRDRRGLAICGFRRFCPDEREPGAVADDIILTEDRTFNDAIEPCRYRRDSICKVRCGADVIAAADCGDIEWRWRPEATPNCRIGIFGELGNACVCLLDDATYRIQSALIADAVPDLTEIARIIALALGPDRDCLIEVETPGPPHWLWEA